MEIEIVTVISLGYLQKYRIDFERSSDFAFSGLKKKNRFHYNIYDRLSTYNDIESIITTNQKVYTIQSSVIQGQSYILGNEHKLCIEYKASGEVLSRFRGFQIHFFSTYYFMVGVKNNIHFCVKSGQESRVHLSQPRMQRQYTLMLKSV